MKKSQIIYYSAGGFVLIAFLILGYWYSRHNLSFTCSSSTASFYSNEGNQPFLNFTQSINFNHLGGASMYISGDLHTPDGTKYMLNRSIFYRYIKIDESRYQLQVTGTVHSNNDNMPDNIEQRYMMPVHVGVRRIFGISKLPTGDIVIANNSGPYLICAVH